MKFQQPGTVHVVNLVVNLHMCACVIKPPDMLIGFHVFDESATPQEPGYVGQARQFCVQGSVSCGMTMKYDFCVWSGNTKNAGRGNAKPAGTGHGQYLVAGFRLGLPFIILCAIKP